MARKQNAKRATPSNSRTKPLARKNTTNNKWHYIIQFFVSLAFLIITTYGANVLNNTSPFWSSIVLIVSLCIFLGYWAWRGMERAKDWAPFKQTFGKIVGLVLVVVVVVLTFPYYVDHFIQNQGSIEMPTFTDDSTQILVHYGSGKQAFWTQTTIGELKQEGGQVPLKINGQNIFVIHVEQNRLYIDTLLFAGVKNQSQHIFNPPVVIKNNAISGKPDGWKVYQNSMALEIDNESGIPVLLLEYKSPYSIIISGLFVTPMGICKVDNENGSGYVLGDTLSQLGVYKVDNVFFRHSVFDLFRPERTYNLANIQN